MKRVDVAVFDVIEVEGRHFPRWRDTISDLKSEGVSVGKIARAAAGFKPKIEAVQKQIVAGKIKIPDTVQ
jgi:basic membrane lipoprotein Med (substrate-binding protein (PBP1-ABC) superfamily)